MIWRFWSGRFMNVIEGGNVNNHPHCTSNLYNFVYAVTIEWQKINELLPLHNVQYEKNTDLSGRPILKNTASGCTNTGKIMYGHMSKMGVFDWIKIIAV
jgi:hypothetical protein